jgi:HlyD family secretion protein
MLSSSTTTWPRWFEYSTGATAPTSDTFDAATEYGVKKLQATLGVTENGTLALGQVVFLPAAARVTSVTSTLGAPIQAGQTVMAATSTTRQVSIALDADQQSEVAVGDHVMITLPNNQTTPGVISSVGTVAAAASSESSDSAATVTVLVSPTDPAVTGSGDQVPVEVSVTTKAVSNALVVPVDALLIPRRRPGGSRWGSRGGNRLRGQRAASVQSPRDVCRSNHRPGAGASSHPLSGGHPKAVPTLRVDAEA